MRWRGDAGTCDVTTGGEVVVVVDVVLVVVVSTLVGEEVEPSEVESEVLPSVELAELVLVAVAELVLLVVVAVPQVARFLRPPKASGNA